MTEIRKAGALILLEKKLLVVKPYGKPFYINPGGKYERKTDGEEETAGECLERELRQELDVALTDYNQFKTYHFDQAAHSQQPLLLELYFVSFSGTIKPSSEIERCEWMSKEDFYAGKFNLAPSFTRYVPDLVKEGYL